MKKQIIALLLSITMIYISCKTSDTRNEKRVINKVILTAKNRNTIMAYSASLNKPLIEAVLPVFDYISIASAKEKLDFNWSLIDFINRVKDKADFEKKSVAESWNELFNQLKNSSLKSFGNSAGLPSSDSGSDESECPSGCEVEYVCLGTSCLLCATNCDTRCVESCASSTGCDPPCSTVPETR